MTKRALAVGLLGLSLARAPVSGAPLDEAGGGRRVSERDRYLELLQRKDRLDRLGDRLKLELDLSAKKKTYLLLDLSDKKLYFKVRGRVFKAIPFSTIEATRGSARLDPLEIPGRAYTLMLKEGKGVETESISLKSLTPEEAAQAGAKEVDTPAASVEQGEITSGSDLPGKTAGTGAPPATQKTRGVAGGSIPPDPPPRYHLGFDGELSIWVASDLAAAPKNPLYERLLPFARSIGRLMGRSDGDEAGTRITLHVSQDHGQQIFRQLVCGQQILIAP